ncbi:hypothetical protein Tco_1299750, partial [Tanacetum coccineum]
VQQQSSYVSSDLVAKFINPSLDTGIDSILNPNAAVSVTPSSATIIPQTPILIIQPQQQTHDSTTTTTIPTTTVLEIPNFASLFGFERRVSSLESDLSELKQTNQFAEALSSILSIVDKYLETKNLYRVLLEAYNSDKDLLSSYGEVVILKRRRDDQDKDEEPSTRSNRGSPPKSLGKSVQEEEHDPRVDDLEEPFHQEFDTGNDDVSPVREATDVDERLWNPSGSRTRTTSLFNEFLATPIDFSAFNIQNLTQDLLTGLTYDIIKGTCKSVVELEYHLEEVFKATNDQLDWHNHEGRLYPHDLSKPLPLIPDARGRLIIPYDYFINNDLEYLKGGSSSSKYTTSITKTKAADYGHIKWIEDKIPRSTWSEAQVVYDKHAYWGTYH